MFSRLAFLVTKIAVVFLAATSVLYVSSVALAREMGTRWAAEREQLNVLLTTFCVRAYLFAQWSPLRSTEYRRVETPCDRPTGAQNTTTVSRVLPGLPVQADIRHSRISSAGMQVCLVSFSSMSTTGVCVLHRMC